MIELNAPVNLEHEGLHGQPASCIFGHGSVSALRESAAWPHMCPRLAPPRQVRRELALVRGQLDGMSQDVFRAHQKDATDLRKKVSSLTLELQVNL